MADKNIRAKIIIIFSILALVIWGITGNSIYLFYKVTGDISVETSPSLLASPDYTSITREAPETPTPTPEITPEPASASPLATQSPTSSYSSIQILGDETCFDQTTQALALLESSASVHFNTALQYIGLIECAEAGSGIYVWEEPPRYQAGQATREAGTIWYAGTIAHEACHSKQYRDGQIYSGREAEAQCLDVQYDALEKMGASQSTLDYIRDVINTEYWEVDYGDRWW